MISIVHPGGLVQGLRVTLMYICSLAKGTDSDNVRHSGPDTSLSHKKRNLTFGKSFFLKTINKNKHIVTFYFCIKNKSPEGNIVKRPYP